MIPEGNTQQLYVMKATLSPAQVAVNTTAEQTFTVPGLRLATDMICAVSKPTAQAGLGIVGWRVTANDTLGITFSNNTAGAITPTASQVYLIQVARIDGDAKTAIAR
jgi:hypothetical protein